MLYLNPSCCNTRKSDPINSWIARNPMIRPLSSSSTFFLKFVFSGIFISCSLWLVSNLIVAIIRSPHDLSAGPVVFIILWSAATTTFCYHLTIPLKLVRIDERYLYVSNYIQEIAIPLAEIRQVYQWRYANVRPVVVKLRSSSRFGDTIKFVPQTTFHWWWNEHPIVSELKSVVPNEEEANRIFDAAS